MSRRQPSLTHFPFPIDLSSNYCQQIPGVAGGEEKGGGRRGEGEGEGEGGGGVGEEVEEDRGE